VPRPLEAVTDLVAQDREVEFAAGGDGAFVVLQFCTGFAVRVATRGWHVINDEPLDCDRGVPRLGPKGQVVLRRFTVRVALDVNDLRRVRHGRGYTPLPCRGERQAQGYEGSGAVHDQKLKEAPAPTPVLEPEAREIVPKTRALGATMRVTPTAMAVVLP